jgi:hypothetical protein
MKPASIIWSFRAQALSLDSLARALGAWLQARFSVFEEIEQGRFDLARE